MQPTDKHLLSDDNPYKRKIYTYRPYTALYRSGKPLQHTSVYIPHVVCGDTVGWETALQTGMSRRHGVYWDFSLTSSFRPHYGPEVDS